jgi:hypothetical protein
MNPLDVEGVSQFLVPWIELARSEFPMGGTWSYRVRPSWASSRSLNVVVAGQGRAQ